MDIEILLNLRHLKNIKNCRVENKQFLIDNFKKIEFNNIECTIGNGYFINQPSYYIKGYK
jgi:hypothetical protein